jgi:hypothetical protein
VIVPFNIVQIGQLRGIDLPDQPFGENGNAIGSTERAGFDNRALDDIENAAEPYRVAVKLLSDDSQSGACRLADAQGKMACLTTHSDDDVPSLGRLSILNKVLDQSDTNMPGSLKTKRWNVTRKREVVIDRLRDMHRANSLT